MGELEEGKVREMIEEIIEVPWRFKFRKIEITWPDGNRRDVCAACQTLETGKYEGYDVIYLVWQDKQGNVGLRKIEDSRLSKDYLKIKKVHLLNKRVEIYVQIDNSRHYEHKRIFPFSSLCLN